jgi:protocatechuate 3,4-dioxygenase beta subunit
VTISQVWTETTADKEGHYRLNVEPGSYTIELRIDKVGALRVSDVAVAAKEIKPLDLKLERGTTLAAVVRDSVTGEPVPGIELWNFMQPGIDGASNDQGLLEIPHMMAGEFEFRVVAKGKRRTELAGKYARWWSPQATKEWEREEKNLDNPLKLPAGTPEDVRKQLERDARVDSKFQRNLDDLTFDVHGNTTAVEIFVEPAVTFTGRVLSPDGEPVSGATVAPAKTGSGNSLTGDTRYSVTTDAEGRFTMLAPAGKNFEYNLIAHDGKYLQWRKWANGATEPFQSQPGEVIEGLEIKLTRGGIVKGTVLDEKGQPKPNVEVRAAAVDMRDNRYYVPTTKTDQDGRYELKFVAPGRQHIQVAPFWLRADEAPNASTAVVEVASDQVRDSVDFKVPAADARTGVVLEVKPPETKTKQ